jgi:hypothetical protein
MSYLDSRNTKPNRVKSSRPQEPFSSKHKRLPVSFSSSCSCRFPFHLIQSFIQPHTHNKRKNKSFSLIFFVFSLFSSVQQHNQTQHNTNTNTAKANKHNQSLTRGFFWSFFFLTPVELFTIAFCSLNVFSKLWKQKLRAFVAASALRIFNSQSIFLHLCLCQRSA